MRLFSISIVAFFLLAPLAQNPINTPVDVYQFKGVMGTVLSTGLNALEARLEAGGHHVETRHHWQGVAALDAIKKSKAKRVALICHSAGCITAKRLAFQLELLGVDVCYLATMDPVGSPFVAGNVLLAENWHQGIFQPLEPSHEFTGEIINNRLLGVTHTQMDKQRHIHDRIVTIAKFRCGLKGS